MTHHCGFGAIARTVTIAILVVAGLGFVTVRPAEAAYSCTSTVSNTTIRDNVIVPANAECTLNGVIVTGSVTVNPGGYFLAQSEDGVRGEIRGNVTASGAETVGLFDLTVRGSVSSANANYGYIGFAEIRGNVTISGGVFTFEISNNTLRGSLTLTNNLNEQANTPEPFGNEVYNNVIRGNVSCSGNVGLVFSDNQVRGRVSDECFA